MTIMILKNTRQVFCKMPLQWNLSGVFLMIRLGLWICACNIQNWRIILITSYQGYILSNTNYHCWHWHWLPVRGGVCQFSSSWSCSHFPFPHRALGEKGYYVQPVFKQWGFMFPFFEAEHLHKLFKIFCMGSLINFCFLLSIFQC